MAFTDRGHIARTGRQDASRSRELLAGTGILSAALIATLAIRQLAPAEAVAPAVVTLLFAGSAMAAGLALVCRRERLRALCFEFAGGLTFVGIALSVFIEPDQLASLAGASSKPE
jgi:hypothetical protein